MQDRGAALRTDLETRAGEPDGKRRARAHDRRCGLRRQQDHAARHRHGDVVRRLPHALPGRPGRRERRRRRQAAEGGGRRRRWRSRKSRPSSISPSRRRAIPKRASCASWKSSASAGLDLRLDPFDVARPRLCADGPQPLHSRRQGPPRHDLPDQLLQPLCEYDFTADLEEKLDEVSAGELELEGSCCAISGRISRPRSTRRRTSRSRRSSPRSTRSSARTSSRRRRTATIRAYAPLAATAG